MTNREILSELKQSYEYISDIDSNEYEQLTKEEKDKLTKIEYLLDDIYGGLYERLEEDEKRVKSLEKEQDEKVYISDDISGDYISDINNDIIYFTYQDTDDYYCWYKDEKYLDDYEEEE